LESALLSKFDSDTGVLIIGHGSRNKRASLEFVEFAEAIKTFLPNIPVEHAFLEFSKPIIFEALDLLRDKSVKKVIAIPAMLFAAGHAKNDIPAVLKSYSLLTGLEILYGRELGLNNLMIGAAGSRLKESISKSTEIPISETLLVVAGRGASDPDANSNVSKITRVLVEALGFGWGETVFSGVTFPLVEPGLRQMVKLGFRRIIVFPYFLFSGVLVSRIRKQTEKVAFEHPEIDFISAEYLGNHPYVIENFLERVDEVFKGETAMNCSLCKYRSDLMGFEKDVGSPQESHHHHFEGLTDDGCSLCESECTGDCDLAQKESVHNSHEIDPSAHLNHPFGPVISSKSTEPKFKKIK
tara:strand:+ start:372 stop:1433 length:1062 start_codon:yes stop_codon:yes gene_type:complete